MDRFNESSHSSEAYDFSHLVEDRKDLHISEAPDAPEKINLQEYEGVNEAVLDFNIAFPEIDVHNKEQMMAIEKHIVNVYNEHKDAGQELLKLLNSKVVEQQDQEVVDSVNEFAKNIEGMTLEDIDKGLAKGHQE